MKKSAFSESQIVNILYRGNLHVKESREFICMTFTTGRNEDQSFFETF